MEWYSFRVLLVNSFFQKVILVPRGYRLMSAKIQQPMVHFQFYCYFPTVCPNSLNVDRSSQLKNNRKNQVEMFFCCNYLNYIMKCKYIHGDFSTFSANGITIGNESGDRDEDGDRKSVKGI